MSTLVKPEERAFLIMRANAVRRGKDAAAARGETYKTLAPPQLTASGVLLDFRIDGSSTAPIPVLCVLSHPDGVTPALVAEAFLGKNAVPYTLGGVNEFTVKTP